MNESILSLLAIVLIGMIWIPLARRDGNRVKGQLERLIGDPSKIASVIREKPDSEGTSNLYVLTTAGEKVLVAYTADADDAERRLQAV